jgi:hypothetical protein
MNYEKKYYKYKQKYVELKKMEAAGLIVVPNGPMIGVPAIPVMSPQVRVTGPIPGPLYNFNNRNMMRPGPGPGPFPFPFPGPAIIAPRRILVSESKCLTSSYKIYAVVKKDELKTNSDIRLLLLDTPDEKHRNAFYEQLQNQTNINVIVKPSGNDVELEFDFSSLNCIKSSNATQKITQSKSGSDLKQSETKSVSVTFEKA